LLATAAGGALGAGYEFDPPRGPDEPVGTIGGGLGPFQPGEWTDDTSVAMAIAEFAATGADLEPEAAPAVVVTRWHERSTTAKDVGVQTRSVLSAAGRRGIGAQSALQESAAPALEEWKRRRFEAEPQRAQENS
jgi:ADP-ribosylglycohydrolase